MCLYLSNDNAAKTASHDIQCYKVMERRSDTVAESIVYGFEYRLGAIYAIADEHWPITRKQRVTGRLYIAAGFHTYTCKRLGSDLSAIMKQQYSLYRCIIPKGALYLRGYNAMDLPNYISNKIAIKELVE